MNTDGHGFWLSVYLCVHPWFIHRLWNRCTSEQGIDSREQLRDGRIIKKTLQDIVESKKIIDVLLRET